MGVSMFLRRHVDAYRRKGGRISDLATRAGVSRQAIDRWTKRGKLPELTSLYAIVDALELGQLGRDTARELYFAEVAARAERAA